MVKRPLWLRSAPVGAAALLSLLLLAAYAKEGNSMDEMVISSPAFNDQGIIPKKYTCDGADVSPPLKIEGVPAAAKSLALIADDPDAPAGTWVHWVIWGMDPKTGVIAEAGRPAGAVEGTNDFGRRGYGGPCPPSGTHRYFFKLYALDVVPALDARARKADLEKAMKGHVLASAQLVGRYGRR